MLSWIDFLACQGHGHPGLDPGLGFHWFLTLLESAVHILATIAIMFLNVLRVLWFVTVHLVTIVWLSWPCFFELILLLFVVIVVQTALVVVFEDVVVVETALVVVFFVSKSFQIDSCHCQCHY